MDELSQKKVGSEDKGEITDLIQLIKEPSLFDNTKFYALRSQLVELVEEIKLKRVTESENEEKIRLLVHEKHELERKQESEQAELFNLTDDNEHKLQEQKRHFEDKIQTLQEQVKKLQLHRECNEKESKILKDDIRSLQWTKYSLEKKLREQEHLLSAHHLSSDQHRNEISNIQKKMASMMSHYQKLADCQKCLEVNVTEAVSHNKKLMYVNEHKSCLMEELKVENSKLKQQIIDCNIKLNHLPVSHNLQSVDFQHQMDSLHRNLKHEEERSKSNLTKAENNNRKYEDVLKLLQEAHELTDSHLNNANKHQKEAGQLREKCDDMEKEITTLKSDVDTIKKEFHNEKIKYEDKLKSWAHKENNLNKEVDDLKDQVLTKENDVLKLEDINSLWAAKNVELSVKLAEAEKFLNIEKDSKETQSGASIFSLQSENTQTILNNQNNSTQTEPKSVQTAKTQCIIPALFNISSQTDNIIKVSTTVDSGAQTLSSGFDKINSEGIVQTTVAEIGIQANLDTSQTFREALAKTNETRKLEGLQTDQAGQSTYPPRRGTPRHSFQLNTPQSIHNQFQEFEKQSASFQKLPSADQWDNKECLETSQSSETCTVIHDLDSLLVKNRVKRDFKDKATLEQLPPSKYPRLSREYTSPGFSESRKTPSTSPFPAMGVKVVASRRESLCEVKTSLDFSSVSPVKTSYHSLQPTETPQSSNPQLISASSTAGAIQESSKGILKNPYKYKINKRKCVKFNDENQERTISPVTDSPQSPDLIEDFSIDPPSPDSTEPTTTYTAEPLYMLKPDNTESATFTTELGTEQL